MERSKEIVVRSKETSADTRNRQKKKIVGKKSIFATHQQVERLKTEKVSRNNVLDQAYSTNVKTSNKFNIDTLKDILGN